ncbi:LacI family transcriptional regulator [Fundicoccus culcitae]|uniref:LacI family transcriptional regulator n=1 Tax=Fundicoccus culcitae TaxID=2969821 RepID=A0ABY5P9T3_9LACT|nr:LacI family transcriptional regulator [Fundicoccus culcitae]
MRNVTIKDIARLSGVSVATVSRVINNNGRFSEETRQKVLQVIEETGYQMNFSAKSLRMNRSFTIGILVPDISNYFFADVVQQIEEKFFELGYSTIICNTARNSDKEQKYLTILESKSVDGIIVISGASEEGIEFNFEKTIPYICIDRKPKDEKNTLFISSNHYQGGFIATEKLIELGSKQPVIVLHQLLTSSSKERAKGFVDAMKKNSLYFDETVNQLILGTEQDDITQQVTDFLTKHPETDSFFTTNDILALKILKIVKTLGINIPASLKVIGFDDVPSSQYSTPTLSSIRQNTEEIARVATKSLLAFIDGDDKQQGKQILIPVELVSRESIE